MILGGSGLKPVRKIITTNLVTTNSYNKIRETGFI